MIDLNKFVPKYDSPINLTWIPDIASQINHQLEDNIYSVVHQYCVDIDRNKLVQALEQDKIRYMDAYRKGFDDGFGYLVTCEKCMHWNKATGYCENIESPCFNRPTDRQDYCRQSVRSTVEEYDDER